MKRILIAGATGFVGKKLVKTLAEKGLNLAVLTRKNSYAQFENVQYYKWDILREKIEMPAFENVDTIINLTGANIGKKRWTPKRKKEIIDSRVKAIELLYKYVTENKIHINTFISSSAVGFYGAITSNTILNENAPNGNDFLANVCKEWETAAQLFAGIKSRVIILRKGIVLGRGAAYKKMASLAKWNINTALGNGKQYMPWIEIDDLINLYYFFLINEKLGGTFNAVATEHITMNDFAKGLLHSFGKKSFLPNPPAFMVKFMFGEMASMLLEGTRVSNEKIKNEGFILQNEYLFDALQKIKEDKED